LFVKDMQLVAARAFSALCFIAYKAQPQLMENASFTGDVSEVSTLSHDVCSVLHCS
jgi:nuclear pore complex protein Nup188